MLIFAADDEPLLLESLRRSIAEAAPDAEIRCFERASALLEALAGEDTPPDAVFSDIELPGMDGLELAARLKALAPATRVVFVTGYSHYALDAYRLHVDGYILKPVTSDRIGEELALLPAPEEEAAGRPERLVVRCFGSFDVFWKGEPLLFSRHKTKELLAYLVDRRGAACTGGEIISALWEDSGNLPSLKSYLRTLTVDLRTSLAGIGMEDLLIRDRQHWSLRTALMDCDYYRMLDGDPKAAAQFHGEYMTQYSWAESTAAALFFRKPDF